MKKLVELEIFFTTGDTITIPAKYVKDFWITGIKKELCYLTDLANNKGEMFETENAEKFKIPISKELLNTRNDFTPYDEDMNIVKNLTYIERIKNYDNLVGVTLRYNHRTERTIGIDLKEDTEKIIRDEGNIITIEIR